MTDHRQQIQESKDEDIIFSDIEDYKSSDKFQKYSHQTLVMNAMSAVVKAGGHEMRSGWYNEKRNAQGDLVRQYIEDTRSVFIECVKTAKMQMICDFDKEADNNINVYIDQLEKIKDDLLKQQWQWFNSQTNNNRLYIIQKYGEIVPGAFNVELPWWQMYIESELDCYRSVFEELILLTKRIDFYAAEDFEA